MLQSKWWFCWFIKDVKILTFHHFLFSRYCNPAGFYLVKVNNGNIRTICEICLELIIKKPEWLEWRRSCFFPRRHLLAQICSKLTIKTPERNHWRRSGVFVVNFGHISHLVLVFLLLFLNMSLPPGLLLVLNRFHTLFWCFLYWLWANNCRLEKIFILNESLLR